MKNHTDVLIFNREFVSEPQTRDRRAKFEIWLAAYAKIASVRR